MVGCTAYMPTMEETMTGRDSGSLALPAMTELLISVLSVILWNPVVSGIVFHRRTRNPKLNVLNILSEQSIIWQTVQ